MKQLHTKEWLRKRCKDNTKEFYLQSFRKMKQEKEAEEVFRKFDDDGSGSLDCKEIYKNFNENGIQISMDKIQ